MVPQREQSSLCGIMQKQIGFCIGNYGFKFSRLVIKNYCQQLFFIASLPRATKPVPGWSPPTDGNGAFRELANTLPCINQCGGFARLGPRMVCWVVPAPPNLRSRSLRTFRTPYGCGLGIGATQLLFSCGRWLQVTLGRGIETRGTFPVLLLDLFFSRPNPALCPRAGLRRRCDNTDPCPQGQCRTADVVKNKVLNLKVFLFLQS